MNAANTHGLILHLCSIQVYRRMLNKQTLGGGRSHRSCSQRHPILVYLLLWLSPQFIIPNFLTFWFSQNQDFEQLNVA